MWLGLAFWWVVFRVACVDLLFLWVFWISIRFYVLELPVFGFAGWWVFLICLSCCLRRLRVRWLFGWGCVWVCFGFAFSCLFVVLFVSWSICWLRCLLCGLLTLFDLFGRLWF